MTGVGYSRPPTLPPFFFNPNDPTSLILARERAGLFGLPSPTPTSSAAVAAAITKSQAGVLWRPQINPNQMYNFLAASAACAPWYLAALAAESSGQRPSAAQMPPHHPAAPTSTASSFPWTSHSGPGFPQGLSFSDLMRQSMSSSSPHYPMRPETMRDSSSPPSVSGQMRYTPFSSHAKDGSEASASPLELTTTSSTSLHSALEK